MRRLGIIAAFTALAILIQTAVCFAVTLELLDSYPKDGADSLQPYNFAAKLYFSQDVSGDEVFEANKKYFRLTDEEGNARQIRIIRNPKDPGMLLVVLEGDLADDTEYTLTISRGLTAVTGATFETEQTIVFRTINLASLTRSSMIMMIVLLIVVMAISARQTKKKAEKEADEKEKRKVNPYKVSKQTGKSVAEIVRKDEKAKLKKAKEEAKLMGELEEEEPEAEEEEEYKEYECLKVKCPRRISEAGSTYKSGKVAKAAAAAAKEAAEKARGTTRPKNQTAKKRNKKK